MKVMLTGSTGFVGLNIVAALQRAGHEIHAYVRANSKRTYLENFPVTCHVGELDDVNAMTRAFEGMHAVIHTAGATSCFKRDYDSLFRVNAGGTRNVVASCLNAGIARLVYTSTTSTIGAHDDRQFQADETTPLKGFRSASPYARTKLLAEQAVLDGCEKGLTGIILNPAEIIGRFDHNFQWGRLVMAVAANRVPFIPPGGGSFCSATEVAAAHVAALTQGKVGERYILAGVDKSYAEFLDEISTILDTPFRRPAASYREVYVRERLKEVFYPALGRQSMVEPYRLRVFAGHYYFSSRKAQAEFDYRVPGLQSMLADCVDWYQSAGLLPQEQAVEQRLPVG